MQTIKWFICCTKTHVNFLSLSNHCICQQLYLNEYDRWSLTHASYVCQTTGYSKCNKIVQICKLLVVLTEKGNSSSPTASTVPQIFLLSSLVALWVRRTTYQRYLYSMAFYILLHSIHFTSGILGQCFVVAFKLRVRCFQLLTLLLILNIFFRKTCFSNKSALQFRNLNNTVKTTKASHG